MKNRHTREAFRPDAPLAKVWVLNTANVTISDPGTGESPAVKPGDEALPGDNALVVTDPTTQEAIKNAFKNVEYKIGTETGTVTYSSANSVLLSGSYPTINTNAQICYIKVDSGTTITYLFSGVDGIYLSYSGGTLTVTGATPFASGDTYEVGINAPKMALDYDLNTNLDIVQNPEWAHYTSVEHPVDAVNLAAASYYQVVDMESYRSAALQILGSGGVTFTAYMTLSEDAPDDDETDTQWEDATTDLFGAASIVDSGAIGFIETLRMPKKILIKYITSDATNAVDIWVRKY